MYCVALGPATPLLSPLFQHGPPGFWPQAISKSDSLGLGNMEGGGGNVVDPVNISNSISKTLHPSSGLGKHLDMLPQV